MPVVNQTGKLVVALASSLFLWLCQKTIRQQQKNNKKQQKTKQNKEAAKMATAKITQLR